MSLDDKKDRNWKDDFAELDPEGYEAYRYLTWEGEYVFPVPGPRFISRSGFRNDWAYMDAKINEANRHSDRIEKWSEAFFKRDPDKFSEFVKKEARKLKMKKLSEGKKEVLIITGKDALYDRDTHCGGRDHDGWIIDSEVAGKIYGKVIVDANILEFQCLCGGTVFKLDLTQNVKEINREAFANTEALKEVVIPRSVKVIEKGAFKNCPDLRKVTLRCSCPIDMSEFAGCDLEIVDAQKCRGFLNTVKDARYEQLHRECFGCADEKVPCFPTVHTVVLPETMKEFPEILFEIFPNVKKLYIPQQFITFESLGIKGDDIESSGQSAEHQLSFGMDENGQYVSKMSFNEDELKSIFQTKFSTPQDTKIIFYDGEWKTKAEPTNAKVKSGK